VFGVVKRIEMQSEEYESVRVQEASNSSARERRLRAAFAFQGLAVAMPPASRELRQQRCDVTHCA
jgi:hypothetical protein